MKRDYKWLLYLLPVAIFSLGGVGYAASKNWNISPQEEASFIIGGDSVREFNEHFYIGASSSSTAFTKDGIAITTSDEDGHNIRYVDASNPLQHYSVTLSFFFDAGNGNTVYTYLPSEVSSFSLRTILVEESEGLSLFDIAGVRSATLTYSASSVTSTAEITQDDVDTSNYSDVCFELNDFISSDQPFLSSQVVSFSVTFVIEFNSDIVTDFKTDVYDKLSNGSFVFSLIVGAEF